MKREDKILKKQQTFMSDEICPISGESSAEERLNHLTHFFGLVFSILGLPCLIIYSYLYGDFWHVASYSIYGTTLLLLYIASTFYHGCKTLHRKTTWRIVDHACIYLLIAGSYTPFALGPLRDSTGWILLALEWSIAVIGILFKIFAFNKFQMTSLVAYIAMGWLVVFNWYALQENLSPTAITLILFGGVSYTFGAIFFLWESLRFNHAIWHLFVLGGSVSHYAAVILIL